VEVTEDRESEEPQFRKFTPDDMAACTKLAWGAWALVDQEPGPDDDPSVMEGYVRSFLMRSNWNEVAFDSHGVVGFLFGRISKGEGREKVASPISELNVIPRFLFSNSRMPPISPIVMVHFFLTELKVLVNVPRSDAEVNLIVVDRTHRGRRLGTSLVNRFVEEAKKSGCDRVTLYTDDQMSNWKFYEIYGFKKTATFHDSLTSYFAEKSANGIVYVLELGNSVANHK